MSDFILVFILGVVIGFYLCVFGVARMPASKFAKMFDDKKSREGAKSVVQRYVDGDISEAELQKQWGPR